MDRTTVGLLIGAVFILIGIVGGGVSVREIQIPRVPQWARIACVAVGLLFVGLPLLYDNDGDETTGLPIEEPRATPSPDVEPVIRVDSPRGPGAEVTPHIDRGFLYVDLKGRLSEPVPPGPLLIVGEDPDGDCYKVRDFSPGRDGRWTEPLRFSLKWCGKKVQVHIIKATEDLESVPSGEPLERCPSQTLADTTFTISEDVCE